MVVEFSKNRFDISAINDETYNLYKLKTNVFRLDFFKLFFKKIWQVLIIVLLLHSLSEPDVVRKRDEIAFFDRI